MLRRPPLPGPGDLHINFGTFMKRNFGDSVWKSVLTANGLVGCGLGWEPGPMPCGHFPSLRQTFTMLNYISLVGA